MPMREECKNFESRTYANGETVRKCNLDLAPDAPWRCPDNCPGYERRLADVGWVHGSLVTPSRRPTSRPGSTTASAAAVLDEAEDIINAVGAEIVAEVAGRAGRRPRAGGASSAGALVEPVTLERTRSRAACRRLTRAFVLRRRRARRASEAA